MRGATVIGTVGVSAPGVDRASCTACSMATALIELTVWAARTRLLPST